jgi:hypothetical protein
VISGFRRDVHEICAVLGYYAAYSVVLYRRFGTTYQSHLQESRSLGPLDLFPVLFNVHPAISIISG